MPEPRRRRSMLKALAVCAALCFAVGSLALVWPAADEITPLQKNDLVVEVGQADDGFIQVRYRESNKALKLHISKEDSTDTYDLNGEGESEVFPLLYGSGTYRVQLYRQASGSKYASVASVQFDARLGSDDAPFLCPNQYVWYTPDSLAVQRSNELCARLETEQAKIDAIFGYIVKRFAYHHIRALTVQSGYVPQLDQVMQDQMGICFDFAALMACMLRVQGVPTRLVIGYADSAYHAWNEVRVGHEWVRYDATAAITQLQVTKYAAERYY